MSAMSEDEENIFISEQEFHEEWGARVRDDGDLFRFEDVRNKPLEHVWSIVETGDDADTNWYALPGFHVVNMLGYVMTTRPWTDLTPDAIYFPDDIPRDDEDEAILAE